MPNGIIMYLMYHYYVPWQYDLCSGLGQVAALWTHKVLRALTEQWHYNRPCPTMLQITLRKSLILVCWKAQQSPVTWSINTSIMDCLTSYSASHGNWCTVTLWNRIMTAQCEGMGEVGSAKYEPALLPPCPSIRVLSYGNCQEIHSRQQTGLAV